MSARYESEGCVVFSDGFQSGKIRVGKAHGNIDERTWSSMGLDLPGKSNAVIVPDPAGGEQLVARFTVPDDGESFRAEIQREQFTWGRYRYAVSHYIPSTWPRFRYGTIITQWHGFAMVGTDGRPRNLHPPIALVVRGLQPEWQLHLYKLPGRAPDDNPLHMYPINVPLTYDCWNDWVFDITWSRRNEQGETVTPGLIVIMLNQEEVLRLEGDNNYHQESPPYFQMGIYRSSWRKGNGRDPVVGRPVVVFHKSVVVTDLDAC